MRKSRFTDEQIIGVLREVAGGAKLTTVCRRLGITETTHYPWKVKFGDMQVPEARRLRALEEENRRLKRVVADQALEYSGAQGDRGKRLVTAEQRRAAVTYVEESAAVSQRHACRWLGVHRTPIRYAATPRRADGSLRGRPQELAGAHPGWGAPLLTWQLHREGWGDNRKRIERVYRHAGLAVRKRSRKLTRPRLPHEPAVTPNARWSMDFMRDTLATESVFRLFNVVDDCTREPLAMDIDTSSPGSAVAAVLTRLVQARGRPQRIVCDNGPEFISRALAGWAAEHGVILQHIQPGKPNHNAFVESFNSRVRDECLNPHWFLSLADARRTIATYQHEYCTARRHGALGDRTPAEFATSFTTNDHPISSIT